jgi:hypothetical protein
VKVALETDPPGADVCLEDDPARLAVTNASFTLARESRPRKLLVHRRGYLVEEVMLPADRDLTRALKLRRLSADDLVPPPPCKR